MNPLAKHKCAINLHLAAYSMILLASSRDLWKFRSLMSRRECKDRAITSKTKPATYLVCKPSRFTAGFARNVARAHWPNVARSEPPPTELKLSCRGRP